MRQLCINRRVNDNGFMARILYRLILDFSYSLVISKYWAYYMNLTLNLSVGRLLLSYCITLVLSLITPDVKRSLSSFFINIQLYIVIIPMCSLYGLSGRSLTFLLGIVICHLGQCVLFSKQINFHFLKRVCLKYNFQLLTIFLVVLLTSVLILLIKQVGFPGGAAFDLNSVYIVREKAPKLNTFMRYLVPWITKVVLPFLLVCCLHKRRLLYTFFIICVQIYFYAVFAQKTFLFTPFLVIGIYWFAKKNYIKWGIEKGLSLLSVTVTILFMLNKNWIMPVSLLVRRVLFVPATIKFAYFEFFSQNKKVHFADGTLGHILGIQSPYKKEIPKIISEFLGRPDSNCNAGYLADAYANGGWIAVVILSCIIVIFIKLLEELGKNLDYSVLVASCAYLFYSLNDAALLTTLLTGGGFLLLFIIGINSMKYSYAKNEKTI